MTQPAQRYVFAKQRFKRAQRILASQTKAPDRRFAEATVALALLDPRDMPAEVYPLYQHVTTLLDENVAIPESETEDNRLALALALLRDAAQRLD